MFVTATTGVSSEGVPVPRKIMIISELDSLWTSQSSDSAQCFYSSLWFWFPMFHPCRLPPSSNTLLLMSLTRDAHP